MVAAVMAIMGMHELLAFDPSWRMQRVASTGWGKGVKDFPS